MPLRVMVIQVLGFFGGLSRKTRANADVDSRSNLRSLGKWFSFRLRLYVLGLRSPVRERARDWSARDPQPETVHGVIVVTCSIQGGDVTVEIATPDSPKNPA